MPDSNSDRPPLVIGNWKMHKTPPEARALAGAIVAGLPPGQARVAVAPPFPALGAVAGALAGSPVEMLAQDAFPEPEGAYTGAVSAPMLAAAGCAGVLVGHSERRQLFGDSDSAVRRKARAVLAAGMFPVVCVGETAEERTAGRADSVVTRQLHAVLEGLPRSDLDRLAVAYEPVWAIGAGRTARPEDAEAMHRTIRGMIAGYAGEAAASRLPILYGGSVKGDNAAAILAGPNVDGVLVGGASLDADSFLAICRAAG